MNKQAGNNASKLTGLILSFALTSAAAMAAEPTSLADDPGVIDAVALWSEWVEYQAATGRVPAVSFGIVHDQELIASGAFGQANPAEDIPATTDTLYSICSISKLFTSVALMQQRDAGKLRLDDLVSQHLDWFDIEDAHPDHEAITIQRLLTHSAGLPRESDFPYWTDRDYPFPTSEQIRERLGDQQTLYPASRYFQYSNLGLSLVGEIVAAASGQPYHEYMREQLLDPLGMADTYTDIPVALHGNSMAVGHTALGRDGRRETVDPFQARGIAPAAGYASNVNDMAKFAMWQFRTLDGDNELLRGATLREMQRVHWIDPDWETTWGLGFSVMREGNRSFARHGGGCPGYFTEFRLEPKTKLAVIVLTSSIGSNPGLFASRAFDLVAPAVAKALASPDETADRAFDPEPYAGVYGSIWGQVAIVPWRDGLAVLGLASSDPAASMQRLQYVDKDTFRIVRDDDESLGEAVEFELGPDGQAARFKRHSIWQERIAN